ATRRTERRRTDGTGLIDTGRIVCRILAKAGARCPSCAGRGGCPPPAARERPYHQQPMALLTASDLHKDIAGRPLLRGVSFKLERRERLTVAGRNGVGKTTLLRMLAGEVSIDRGEPSVAKGVRVALHDQRPPVLGPGSD